MIFYLVLFIFSIFGNQIWLFSSFHQIPLKSKIQKLKKQNKKTAGVKIKTHAYYFSESLSGIFRPFDSIFNQLMRFFILLDIKNATAMKIAFWNFEKTFQIQFIEFPTYQTFQTGWFRQQFSNHNGRQKKHLKEFSKELLFSKC